MLDANHWYSREDALYIGRELEKLDYYWYEEPMDEHSTSSYVWLAKELRHSRCWVPRSAQGKFRTRAEWIVREASDITRTGVIDVGGIGPSMKVAHLAEAHGIACEIHGGGPGNLAVLGAMFNGRWYERGLLHPFIDYDEVPRVPEQHHRSHGLRTDTFHCPNGPDWARTSTSNTSTNTWLSRPEDRVQGCIAARIIAMLPIRQVRGNPIR